MSNCICCANGNDLPEGEECAACGRVGPAIHDHGLRLRDATNAEVRSALKVPTPAQSPAQPTAWRYTCADGSVVLMLKRLTDEQKRRGYYTGEDGEDEVDGDEALVGPFYWAEETPLYAAQPPAAPVAGLIECPTCVRRFKPGEHCDLATCSLKRCSADSVHD